MRAAYKGYKRRITTENTWNCTTQQGHSRQCLWRLVLHTKMIYNFSDTPLDLPFDLTAICKEAYEAECGQLYAFDFAEAAAKLLENQSNQGCIVEVMQWLSKLLWEVNTFADPCKRMNEMKYMNK